MTQEKSMLCYISMTRNSRLGQIDRKSISLEKHSACSSLPLIPRGVSILDYMETGWYGDGGEQPRHQAWAGAVHTRLDMGLPQPLQSQWGSGWKSPVITLQWLSECELVFSAWCVPPSMFDSEKVCIAYTPSMRHLSYKPVCRHRILILLPSSCLGISTVNGLCQLGVFSSSFSRKSSENDQEGRESIFLSCDGFAGLAALKSIKTSFFFLPKVSRSHSECWKGLALWNKTMLLLLGNCTTSG